MTARRTSLTARYLDRFLLAFVNYGWRGWQEDAIAGPEDLAWFGRRGMAEMLPQMPRQATDEYRQTHHPDYVDTWQRWLRYSWAGLNRTGPNGSEAARKNSLLEMIALRFMDDAGITPNPADSSDYHANVLRVFERVRRDDLKTGFWPTGFLQALRRALELAPWMRKCKNRECSHPFFLYKRTTDKYCSIGCAQLAELRRKAKWWDAHKQPYLNERKRQRGIARQQRLRTSRKEKR